MKTFRQVKGICAMPNERELEYAKKLGMSSPFSSPFAIWNRAAAANAIAGLVGTGPQEQATFQAAVSAYPKYEMLLHFQLKQGVTLSAGVLTAMDQAQDVKGTDQFVVYQQSADVPLADFKARLDAVDKAFTNKNRLPVLDPAAMDLTLLQQKAVEVGQRAYDAAVILYRNPARCLQGWQVIQSTLQKYGVEMVAVNVFYRMFDTANVPGARSKISTLTLPMVFGCKAMAHYRPRTGRKSPILLLSQDMNYEAPAAAGTGPVTYAGANRQARLQALPAGQHYNFSRVDALLQMHEMLKAQSPLRSTAQIKSLATSVHGVRDTAKHLGLI